MRLAAAGEGQQYGGNSLSNIADASEQAEIFNGVGKPADLSVGGRRVLFDRFANKVPKAFTQYGSQFKKRVTPRTPLMVSMSSLFKL